MTDGLNVIDLLDDNTVYTYQDPQALNTRAPLGDEPDSAAADPATGQIVVPSEGNAIEYVVDLSQATFDKAHKSVTAPHIAIDASNADELTGVAIEPTSHIAFFESELGPDMGAADLSAETAAQPSYLHAAVPPLPDGTDGPTCSTRTGSPSPSASSAATPLGSWSTPAITGSRAST